MPGGESGGGADICGGNEDGEKDEESCVEEGRLRVAGCGGTGEGEARD